MSANAKLFMKLTGVSSGVIKGESQAEGFEDQIELDDWKWAVGRDASAASAHDGSTGIPPPPAVVEPSVFGFSKLMDRSTTGMLSAMRSGELMTAVVTLEEAADVDFELNITLSQVRVLSYSLNARDAEKSGSIEEEWTFNYQTIRFDYLGSRSAGKTTFTMTRPPNASSASPTTKSEELRKIARDVPGNELARIWDLIQEDKRTLRPGAKGDQEGAQGIH